MTTMRGAIAVLALMLLVRMEHAAAAPIRPTGPFDVCGVIESSEWSPSRFRTGKPGWSGSIGHDVTFPAHFRVTLGDYTGVPAREARRINNYLGAAPQTGGDEGAPPRLDIWLNSEDPALLRGVKRLCVFGFEVRGDEGGTWTSHTGHTLDE